MQNKITRLCGKL